MSWVKKNKRVVVVLSRVERDPPPQSITAKQRLRVTLNTRTWLKKGYVGWLANNDLKALGTAAGPSIVICTLLIDATF